MATVFRNGGREAITVGQDLSVIVWDADSGKELRRFDASGPALSPLASPDSLQAGRAAISSDGRTVAVVGRARNLDVWDIDTGKVRRNLGAFTGSQLALSPDGKYAAVSDQSGQSRLWELAGNDAGLVLGEVGEFGRNYVYRLDFSSDGKSLLQVGLQYPRAAA